MTSQSEKQTIEYTYFQISQEVKKQLGTEIWSVNRT